MFYLIYMKLLFIKQVLVRLFENFMISLEIFLFFEKVGLSIGILITEPQIKRI